MSGGETPARPRARIKAKDEAEFERWRFQILIGRLCIGEGRQEENNTR
jgi:hypothetical protein